MRGRDRARWYVREEGEEIDGIMEILTRDEWLWMKCEFPIRDCD
jgi:hypothetical protein